MLVAGKIAEDTGDAWTMLEENIENGKGLEKFRQLILAQGGDPGVLEDYGRFKQPALSREIVLEEGWVQAFDTEAVGRASAALGAGRTSYDMPIDPSAGIVLNCRLGDRSDGKSPFAVLYSDDEKKLEEGSRIFAEAVTIGGQKQSKPEPVLEIIR